MTDRAIISSATSQSPAAANWLARLGAATRAQWRHSLRLAAISAGLLWLLPQPGRWPRTTRNVLARQILFTGVHAARFIGIVAVIVGLAVVLQARVWLARAGQSALVGPLLVAVIIREVGPLLVNFIVIGRSGTAIAAELASMRVAGEVEVLDAQGLDPMAYLVLPRAVGAALSVLGLTVFFVALSLASGFLIGRLLGAEMAPARAFLDSVFGAVSGADLFNLLAKSLAPGWLMAVICADEGLSVRGALTEVPQAASRAVTRSVAALFVVSAVVSAMTYL